MSTLATTDNGTGADPGPGAGTSPTRAARPDYRVTGRRVLASEWAKLWSLRSTWITLTLGLLFLVAFGVIAAIRYKALAGSPRIGGDFAASTAVSLSLFGANFAQLALGVLGVLITAGEYSTGTIRSTMTAVPRRLPVLWSKAAVYGVVALVVGLVGAFVAFLIGGGLLAGTPAALGLGHAGVLRSLLGAGLYLGLVGVVGIALGALLRSVAGAVAVLIAALMLIPGLATLLPTSWQDNVTPYLPSNAGHAMFALTQDPTTLSPLTGLLVFVGWTVLVLAGAGYRMVRSDV
ncbi:ABC transporter permease [Streptomyces sp. J2-1]|uniref:ABC transporter permease n=1 Tax=Streptomyces corallincola TaxID=2851888 RepID=UPI001C38F8F8|nr:ABC transporter permease [Streptomyces corallincola]MBV2354993.1 ABC transporter permease [Streptomyces corallincola]